MQNCFFEIAGPRRHAVDSKVRLPFHSYAEDEKERKEESIQEMDYNEHSEDEDDEDKTTDQHFITQDTGYQTNSLQSTNNMTSNMTGFQPEHTNLTVQFGNLCGDSQTGIETEDSQPPIPRKVTSLISPGFTLVKSRDNRSADLSMLSDYSIVQNNDPVSSVKACPTGVPVFPWKQETFKKPMETKSAVIKEKIIGNEPELAPSNSLPASKYAHLVALLEIF
jgi:hypothetical protein